MRIANSILSRYSQTLFCVATKQGVLGRVYEDFSGFLKMTEANEAFANFLKNPLVRTREQKRILDNLKDYLHPLTFQFSMLLIRKKRLSLLFPLIEAYMKLYESGGERVACVTTAFPIDEVKTNEILALAQKLVGNDPVRVVNEVDPAILGGYILHLDPYTLDASLRTRTRQLLALWKKKETSTE
jgi:F-type H+-transporting ATPase subunit delta